MAGGRNPGIRMLSARITGRSAVRTTRLASDNWNSGSPAVFPGTGKWMRIFAVPVPFVRRFLGICGKKPNFRKRTQPSCHENPWIFRAPVGRPARRCCGLCRAARRRTVRQGRVPHRHARQRSPLHGGLYAQGARQSPRHHLSHALRLRALWRRTFPAGVREGLSAQLRRPRLYHRHAGCPGALYERRRLRACPACRQR